MHNLNGRVLYNQVIRDSNVCGGLYKYIRRKKKSILGSSLTSIESLSDQQWLEADDMYCLLELIFFFSHIRFTSYSFNCVCVC